MSNGYGKAFGMKEGGKVEHGGHVALEWTCCQHQPPSSSAMLRHLPLSHVERLYFVI
ncbi:hypothetical protein Hanom_Chr00s060744g01785041 [Helianthus anomalus]